MQIKEIGLKNIIPGVILLVILVGLLIFIRPTSYLKRGRKLYEKNGTALNRAYTTKSKAKVKIIKRVGNLYKVKLTTPPVTLWAPAWYFKGLNSFPGSLIMNASAGRLKTDPYIFKTTHVTEKIKSSNGKSIHFKHNSIYFIPAALILFIVLLQSNRGLIKNISALFIATFYILFIVYSGGIIKSYQQDQNNNSLTVLNKIITKDQPIVYCQKTIALDTVYSIFGNKVKPLLRKRPGNSKNSYAYWGHNPGKRWKLLAGGKGLKLYMRR